MTGRFGITALALILAGCGASSTIDGPPDQRVPRVSADDAPAWPSTGIGAAERCAYEYPDDLADRAIAFDGTIVGITRGQYDDDAGAVPIDLEVRVNQPFRGDLSGVVTMHTWDFMLPGRDVTGVRVLAAAGPTMDLMGCGFTRPYSEAEAGHWRDVFSE